VSLKTTGLVSVVKQISFQELISYMKLIFLWR